MGSGGQTGCPEEPTGKRRYTEEMLYCVLGLKNREEPRKVVLYARVSSAGQKPDLENQLNYLKEFAAGRGITVDETLPMRVSLSTTGAKTS